MKESRSIIVPTLNAGASLEELLSIIEYQSTSGYSVTIIDSSSEDSTQDIAKAYKLALSIIPQEEFDHGGVRSMAKTLTSGDIIVYLTQDALPLSVKDIDRLVSVFNNKSIGAAFGRQIPYKETGLFGKHLRKFNYNDESYIRDINDKDLHGIKTAFLSSSFAAYRRSAMDEIGWFKDGLILGEDTYAGAKLLKKGYKLAYVADAQVYHSHSYTVL